MNRKPNTPAFGSSIIDSRLQDANLAKMYRESERDVNTFKGTLLGVEDELIDAIINVAYSSRPASQEALEPPYIHHSCSQPRHETWEGPLLGSEGQLVDALASPSEQCSDVSTSPRSSESPAFRHFHPHPHPEFDDHKRRRSTVSHTVWNPWAVEIHDDRFGSDNSDESMLYYETKVATIPVGVEHLGTNCTDPVAPCFHTPSQPTEDSGPLEAKTTSIASNDLVVDSIILERPASFSRLGTWNLNDWQANMSDLLAVENLDDDRQGNAFSN